MSDGTGSVPRTRSRRGVAGLALMFLLAGCTRSDDQLRPGDAGDGGQQSERPPAIEIFCERPTKQLPSCTPLPGVVLTLPELGLPPEGIEPSLPETSERVMKFGSGNMFDVRAVSGFALGQGQRLVGCGSWCFWNVYADGRFVWSYDGVLGALDGMVPAYLERRLTPEGVELLRAEILSSPAVRRGPGKGYASYAWFSVAVVDGDRVSSFNFPDDGGFTLHIKKELYARVANPGSWLPASAWADPRIRPFVPSHYFVYDAIQPRALPPPADALLRPRRCQLVSTEVARELVTAFENELEPTRTGPADPSLLEYRYKQDSGRAAWLSLAPALPHETNC